MSLGSQAIVRVMACLVGFLTLASSIAGAQNVDGLVWQFREGNDPDNKGRMTAHLVYGIPETDAAQFMGVCDATPGTGVNLSSLTFAADIGTLANGAETQLQFSGGGIDYSIKGIVQRAEGEGLSGVVLSLEHSDQLWSALTQKDELDYLVPGYKSSSLSLAPGRDKLVSFIEACRSYASNVQGGTEGTTPSSADDADKGAKSAFEAAKELGTADAWNAFIANYPSGFHADLARAYLKKLGDSSNGASIAVTTPPGEPEELSCSEQGKIRSLKSDHPTKITFKNNSGMYRAILWADFNGNLKDYGGLNPGEQITLDTFLTHPWMIATGPGDCLQFFLPASGSSVVQLRRLPADDGPAPDGQSKPKKKDKLVCGANYKLRNGECVLKQNCGKNARRSPEGDCYCKDNYEMHNGKCRWKQDKQGFEVAPWKKPGCKSLERKCNQGSGKACKTYEETCQVN